MRHEALQRQLGDPRCRRLLRTALARDHHVGLEQGTAEIHALHEQLVERPLQRAGRHVVAALDRVVGVHQYLGLDDRDDPGFLAQGRVAGECVRVGPDARDRGDAVADRDHRAPLGEARAEGAVLVESAPKPVEALRDLLAWVAGPIVRPGVHLDPGDRALRGEHLRKRRAVVGCLSNRLVVQDDAADEVLHPGRGKEKLAVIASALLRRLHTDRVEALLDRARGLVGGEDALVVGDDRLRGLVQLVGSI